MLEKWYVWDGVSIIVDAYKALSFEGVKVNLKDCNPLGSEEADKDTFVAYTLGEKVESKRGVK